VSIYTEIREINASIQDTMREVDKVRREHGVKPGESLYDALGIEKWWEAPHD
jgi:hypothetical protein